MYVLNNPSFRVDLMKKNRKYFGLLASKTGYKGLSTQHSKNRLHGFEYTAKQKQATRVRVHSKAKNKQKYR